MDWDKRQKDIMVILHPDATLTSIANTIIVQEKSMIEQAKKEAVKEFADKLKEEDIGEYSFVAWKDLNIFINELLKEWE